MVWLLYLVYNEGINQIKEVPSIAPPKEAHVPHWKGSEAVV